MKLNYAESVKVLPLLGSDDIVATATASKYIDLNMAAGLLELEVNFGDVASTDSTGGVVVTIEASTAASSNATEAAIAFNYRLSAAVDTDLMGAITAATTAGATVLASAADNKTLLCYVDPSAVAGTADMRYIRAVITPTAEVTSTNVGVVARYIPRYAGNAQPSST
jgi:hypothetical protein